MAFPVELSLIQDEERKLPADLRVRLHRLNGGEVGAAGDDWLLFPVFDPSDRRRIARTANHIARETRAARAWPDFPPEAIAIAENGGGDLLIVRAGSDEIELWDHETGETSSVEVDWR